MMNGAFHACIPSNGTADIGLLELPRWFVVLVYQHPQEVAFSIHSFTALPLWSPLLLWARLQLRVEVSNHRPCTDSKQPNQR